MNNIYLLFIFYIYTVKKKNNNNNKKKQITSVSATFVRYFPPLLLLGFVCNLYKKCAFIYWVVCFCLLPYYSSSCQLLVPVPPEYWTFKMASLCYFLVLSHGLALFAVPRCYSDSISNFLIFPLPADHSWQRNREQKSWRGLKTNKKGSAYFQEKGWYLWLMWVF